ncbi:MAG: hypothetical protein ACXVBJ_09605 [Flavisolibacter sp.]
MEQNREWRCEMLFVPPMRDAFSYRTEEWCFDTVHSEWRIINVQFSTLNDERQYRISNQ